MSSNKFTLLRSAITSVFATQAWKDEGIQTTVDNFNAQLSSSEYINVSIVPSGFMPMFNSVRGQLIIQIYLPAGKGSKRAFEIADTLDKHFSGKVSLYEEASLQFFDSYLQQGRPDDAKSLFRTDYHINFKFFAGR